MIRRLLDRLDDAAWADPIGAIMLFLAGYAACILLFCI